MSKRWLRAVAVAAVAHARAVLRCLAVCLGAALAVAAWSPAAHAAGLFLPVAGKEAAVAAAALGEGPSQAMAWERRVRVLHHELAGVRADVQAGDTGRLWLNIRPGVALDVAVERTAPTKWGYSLSGRIEGDQVGFVTFVVHDRALAGSIWTPDAAYEVRHLGGGVHGLGEVTSMPPVECGGAMPEELAAGVTHQRSGADGDDGSTVDILVVWTTAREQQAGGVPQVRTEIDWFIAFTNDALQRSGAFLQLRLVGAEAVDYEDTGSPFTSLQRLSDPADGHLDAVTALRDALGADLVSLAVGRAYRSNVANVLGPFSVIGRNPSTFAHEIGHNLGLDHERDGRIVRQQAYGHGFTIASTCQSTIMSYGDRCVLRDGTTLARPVPFYASPWHHSPWDGEPLGVSRFTKLRGPAGPADAVLALNRNRHAVANFRLSPGAR